MMMTTFLNVWICDGLYYWSEPGIVDVFVSTKQYINYEYAEVSIKDLESGIEYRFLRELHIINGYDAPIIHLDEKVFDKPKDKYNVTVRLLNDLDAQIQDEF